MSEKMLVTQALDERDLLVKKISDKIDKASFVDGEADFEGILKSKMQDEYNERVRTCDLKNSQLQNTAESMRLSILGKDSKTKDDKPLGVVDAYVKENTTELVDPLDIKKKIESLEEKNNTLLKELDTQIKVSNATTLIEIA